MALLSSRPSVLGIDGAKMSKTRGNTIPLGAGSDDGPPSFVPPEQMRCGASPLTPRATSGGEPADHGGGLAGTTRAGCRADRRRRLRGVEGIGHRGDQRGVAGSADAAPFADGRGHGNGGDSTPWDQVLMTTSVGEAQPSVPSVRQRGGGCAGTCGQVADVRSHQLLVLDDRHPADQHKSSGDRVPRRERRRVGDVDAGHAVGPYSAMSRACRPPAIRGPAAGRAPGRRPWSPGCAAGRRR